MKKLYVCLKPVTGLFLLLLNLSAFAQEYTDGILVLNEGGAGSNNSTVSFIKNNSVTNNIYGTANSGAVLGDTGQSMSFNGDYAYIVLNISNKIKVVNRLTFELVATINTGLSNPRYMAFSNGKGFVTNWGDAGSGDDDYVAVVNLENNTIESNIALAEGVERIIETNGKLYVAHMGGYGFGNTVTVIDPVTATVSQTITVGDVPNSMFVKDGFLYVLCGGKPFWAPTETYGSLVKIDLADNTVANTMAFTATHPQNLKAGAGNSIYYTIDEAIYQADITTGTLPNMPLFSTTPQGAYGIYGMDVIDNKIYLADAGNYVAPGHVYIYDTTGSLLENYTVGVIPNSFYKSAQALGTVSHQNALQIVLAPNPASEKFYINTDKTAIVHLYDIQGRLVKNETYTVSGINVSGMNRGIYIVEITIGETKSTQRLVIK